MLYWLADLSGTISVFNVFRYLTVRTGGAMITALIFVFLFGIVADATSLYTGFYLLAGIILFANLLVFFMPDETAPSAIRGKEVTERNRGPLFRRPAGPSLRRAPPPGSV